jgi:unspecific monooxygenase
LPVPGLTAIAWLLARPARRARAALSGIAAGMAQELRKTAFLPTLERDDLRAVPGLRDQILTVLLAGHETTAATAAWCLDRLAHRPDLAEAVAAEGGALGQAPADATNLPFTIAVVKETLRLNPPVWALPRRAAEPARFAGFEIRAGTQILVNIYGIHRHPRYWVDPEAFFPERFLGEAPDPPHYMPFGAGARHCIGRHFGIAESALIVARLCASLRLEPCGPPPRAAAGLTLRPAERPQYRVRPRPGR